MKIEKLLNELPETLTPNTIYLVKKNNEVISYITDSSATPQVYTFKNEEICLLGPTTVFTNSVSNTYYITNFNSFKPLIVTAIDGTVTVTGTTIIYDAPTTPGPSGFIVNGKQYTINVVEDNINFAPSFAMMTYGVMLMSNSPDDTVYFDYPNDTIIDNSNNIITLGTNYTNTENLLIMKQNSVLLYDTTFNELAIRPGILRQQIGYSDFISMKLHILSTGKYLIQGMSYYDNFGTIEPAITTVRYNIDGTIDHTYGTNGIKQILISDLGIGTNITGIGNSLLLANDELLVVCGILDVADSNSVLVKLDNQGNIDNNFSSNGLSIYISEVTVYNTFLHVEKQTDNKILCIGIDKLSSSEFDNYFIVRFNSNGTIDTTYGNNGIVSFNDKTISTFIYPRNIAVQPDNKLLICGYGLNGQGVLIRHNTDGTLDTTYSTNYSDIVQYNDILILQDNKILITGYSEDQNTLNSKAVVTRLNSDLTLDTAFGVSGHYIKNMDYYTQAMSINKFQDNKLLVTCSVDNIAETENKVGYLKLTQDGVLDTTFNFSYQQSTDGITYYNGVDPVIISPNIIISDPDLDGFNSGLGDYNGAVINLNRPGNVIDTDDRFSLSGDFVYVGDPGNHIKRLSSGQNIAICHNTTQISIVDDPDGVSIGNLSIEFINNPTTADVNELVRAIRYSSVATNLTNSSFQLQWTVSDENGNNLQGVGGVLQDQGIVQMFIYPNVLLNTYCVGTTKMGTYADGRGNTYDSVIQINSVDCGFGVAVNQSPVITIKTPINYFPDETIILDPDATIVDPELTLLTFVDNVYNQHSGVYNGASLTIRRANGTSVNDLFLLNQDNNKGNIHGNSGIINVSIPGIPNWSMGTVNMTSMFVDSQLVWGKTSELIADFSLGAFQQELNYFIQSLSYRHIGDGPNTIVLELIVNDGNSGSQGTGGVGSTTVNITLLKPNLIVHDTFVDTDGVVIHDHAPLIGGQWLRGRDIIYNYAQNNNQYSILNNKLIKDNTIVTNFQNDYLWNDVTTPNAKYGFNTEIKLLFTLDNITELNIYTLHRVDSMIKLPDATTPYFNAVACKLNLLANGNFTLQLCSEDNIGNTLTGTINSAVTNGQHLITSRLVDNTIKYYYDGVLLLSHTFELITGIVPNVPGKPGFMIKDEYDSITIDDFKTSTLIDNTQIYAYDSFYIPDPYQQTLVFTGKSLDTGYGWENGDFNSTSHLEIGSFLGVLNIAKYSPGDVPGTDTPYASAQNIIIDAWHDTAMTQYVSNSNYSIQITFDFDLSKDDGSFIGIIARIQKDYDNVNGVYVYNGNCVNINLDPGTKYSGSSWINNSTWGTGLMSSDPVQLSGQSFNGRHILRVDVEGLQAKTYIDNELKITHILDPVVANAGWVGFRMSNRSISGTDIVLRVLDFKISQIPPTVEVQAPS
jgi:uncharacterized delta-60 repeat protein